MENQPNGITIFASFLHTHLLGKKMYVHHYRNNTELPMISKDEHYDFDYQETRHLPKPVVLKPVSIWKIKVTKFRLWKFFDHKGYFVFNLRRVMEIKTHASWLVRKDASDITENKCYVYATSQTNHDEKMPLTKHQRT